MPPPPLAHDAPRRARRGVASSWPAWLLVILATAIWCWHHERWTADSWHLPTNYSGDAHETLARVKAASEGDMWPGRAQVISRLGAPFGAYWNGYPTPDKLLMLVLGGLSRLVGLFAAVNLGQVLAQVTAALSFFLVGRWLRVRWEWALMGGLLFAYTYSTFSRGLPHLSLLFTWTVPLGLLAAWLVAGSSRLERRRPGGWICLGAAIALGAHNPYNLFFWLQLMGWALVAQWLGRRRRANLQIGVTAMALGLAVCAFMHLETWVYGDEPGGTPLLARNYGGTERYALKPVEIVIPPRVHRWEPLAFFGNRYARWSDWRGEEFQPYLGLAGIVGLAWLGGLTVRRIFQRQALPGPALAVGWLAAFASVGGVTNLLAFFAGLQVFRATNRVGIFISAIVLFFLVVRVSRATANWPRGLRIATASLAAIIGILDQVPRRATAAQTREIADAVDADRALGRELETALPDGAMLFQLPVQGFPEVVPPWKLIDYELFRPYLVTESLRFSYGAAKFRARSRWQRDLENVPTKELVRRLEEYGFAALYLNRKGFEDRADKILRDLDDLGYTRRLQSARGHQVVVPLRPSHAPRLPLARRLTYGRGWHGPAEGGVRWAYDDAVLSYYNPFDQPIDLELRLAVVAVGPRIVTLLHEDRPVGSIAADQARQILRVQAVKLHPGVNRFRLTSDQPPERQGTGRYQLRSFGLARNWLQVRSAPYIPAAMPE